MQYSKPLFCSRGRLTISIYDDHATLAAANAFGRKLIVVRVAINAASATIDPHPDIIRGGSDSGIWLAYMNGDHYRATVTSIENVGKKCYARLYLY